MSTRWLILVLVICCGSAVAQDVFLPPPLEDEHLPALIYMETSPDGGESKLFMAHRRGENWQRALMAGAGYIRLFQLDGPKLLIAVGEDASQARIHLVDLAAGSLQIISGRRGLDAVGWEGPGHRLRHWPENNTVFLFQDSETEDTIEFITIEYGTMETKADMIPKTRLAETWHTGNAVRIAANGAHFAWLEKGGPVEDWDGAQQFRLKTFHFNDRSVSIEDEAVVARVTRQGGVEPFWPPFDWSDFNELSYVTLMPSEDPGADRAVFSFRKVDVHAHQPEEYFPELMPLTRDGGELYRDSALRALVFVHTGVEHQKYIIDPFSMTLFTHTPAPGITLSHDGGMHQVVDASRLLLNTEAALTLGEAIRTPRSAHRAFALQQEGEERQRLYVGLEDGDPEEMVASAGELKPLAWIE